MDTVIQQLQERLSQLEFENDQLTAEINYVNKLLKNIGFTDGLESVKKAAQELSVVHERLYEDGLPDDPPGIEE